MNTPILVALDFPAAAPALDLAQRLSPELCRLKVGKELFTRSGPQLVEQLQARGFEIFLDLKFHDIPNTVAGALRSAAELGVWMVNVHAGGGRRMLEAAAESLQGSDDERRWTDLVTRPGRSRRSPGSACPPRSWKNRECH